MKEFMGSMFDVETLAHFLGVARITVYRLAERRDLPGHKIGGQWRFLRDEVDRWLRGRRRQPSFLRFNDKKRSCLTKALTRCILAVYA